MQILSVPQVQECVTGLNVSNDPTLMALYPAFIGTIVQYLLDSTNNVNDHIRFARNLWPRYIGPIYSTRASLVDKHDGQVSPELVATLGQDFLSHIRDEMERQVRVSGPTLNGTEMSIVAKLLLLSGFLCQTNRPDRDKHLFSIQKNGRRRKSTSGEQERDLAYELAVSSQPKVLRQRSFPLERLLSVLVSLLSLNPHFLGEEKLDRKIEATGSTGMFKVLASLQEMGLLVEHPVRSSKDPIRISEPRLTCTLTREEAEAIAVGIDFPLDRYLL